jgi:hypothetical protein
MALGPAAGLGFIGLLPRRFVTAFVRARFFFDQCVIWHYDQFLAYLQIGIGAHIAVRSGTPGVENVLHLIADAFADNEADNRAV